MSTVSFTSTSFSRVSQNSLTYLMNVGFERARARAAARSPSHDRTRARDGHKRARARARDAARDAGRARRAYTMG